LDQLPVHLQSVLWRREAAAIVKIERVDEAIEFVQ